MTHPANLSKSKLVAFRQCPRRLWLEIHHPELRQDSAATLASFAAGYTVGDVARKLYDPKGSGTLIDVGSVGYPKAFALTQEALTGNKPIFEAGFSAQGALAFADVMLPVKKGRKSAWRMVEVKSSSEVKDYHRDDVAIQTFVALQSGVPLIGASVAHVDTEWTYPGGGDYRGLLVEEDLTDEAFGRSDEVKDWIAAAQSVAKKHAEPVCHTGDQCIDPFDCGFFAHCRAGEPVAKHPVEWLPRIQAKALKEYLAKEDVIDMAQVPDELLNSKQLRVKQCTLKNEVYFDAASASRELAPHALPGLFLDFETIKFVVPIWAGTRPYQQIPFQFSCHMLGADGKLSHTAFLDLSGEDPSERFGEALAQACRPTGPIFVYNKGFEGARIRELAERCPKHRAALQALLPRLVDLLPVAGDNYYHPNQQGSWSIKKVLPTMAPELRYEALQGVQDGGAAMTAYSEAIAPDTSAERKAQINGQLLAYCRLDTFAMVRVWKELSGLQGLDEIMDTE